MAAAWALLPLAVRAAAGPQQGRRAGSSSASDMTEACGGPPSPGWSTGVRPSFASLAGCNAGRACLLRVVCRRPRRGSAASKGSKGSKGSTPHRVVLSLAASPLLLLAARLLEAQHPPTDQPLLRSVQRLPNGASRSVPGVHWLDEFTKRSPLLMTAQGARTAPGRLFTARPASPRPPWLWRESAPCRRRNSSMGAPGLRARFGPCLLPTGPRRCRS